MFSDCCLNPILKASSASSISTGYVFLRGYSGFIPCRLLSRNLHSHPAFPGCPVGSAAAPHQKSSVTKKSVCCLMTWPELLWGCFPSRFYSGKRGPNNNFIIPLLWFHWEPAPWTQKNTTGCKKKNPGRAMDTPQECEDLGIKIN